MGTAGSSGYWRLPSRLPPRAVNVEGDVKGELDTSPSDDFPRKLEEATRLGLKTLARVLRAPLDVTDSNLTRSQAAIGAVNALLRADEQRLKAKVQGDVLERLLRVMAEERKKLRRGEGDESVEAIALKDLRPSGDGSKDSGAYS